MYLGRFLGVTLDTCKDTSGYMYLWFFITIHQDTPGYMRDTCGIHPRYILRYMYLKCILRGTYLRCRIHAGYMRDTCGIHVSSEVIKIHARYMRDTCGDTCSDTCGTRISGVRGDVLMPSWRAAHLSGHPCLPCAEMGLLQHPPAPPSSALSWPPLSQ